MSLPNETQALLNKSILETREQQFVQVEYTANQTDTEIIPSPGAGKQIVVHYGSIRTSANTGEAYFHPADDSFKMFQVYIDNFTNFAAGNLYIPCGENQAIQMTSTQGANNIYGFVTYSVVDV